MGLPWFIGAILILLSVTIFIAKYVSYVMAWLRKADSRIHRVLFRKSEVQLRGNSITTFSNADGPVGSQSGSSQDKHPPVVVVAHSGVTTGNWSFFQWSSRILSAHGRHRPSNDRESGDDEESDVERIGVIAGIKGVEMGSAV